MAIKALAIMFTDIDFRTAVYPNAFQKFNFITADYCHTNHP
jgi:hypothetical protein